ncbi:hypothetical protein SAMN04487895_101582 [Paenibacillus sophorae]|uniref:Uncharacterized protein n=1 Tax=Paenibacillus sophorae TaxID=1333845 RepID=A0A1H8GNL5_9BACL|nr:hypothetical protein [Paenibacillus sophorae]QWU14284.1 hypothetical protein KP014_20470 [Paenibacillus sophorae]SEN45430.1 hypothetical protein SAMN04487895_101582 [Paenibacillus sophorae]
MNKEHNYDEVEMVCTLKMDRQLTEDEKEILRIAYGVGFGSGIDAAIHKFEENGWG